MTTEIIKPWQYLKTHKDGTKSVALKSKDWMLDNYAIEEFPADDGLNGISTLRDLIHVNLDDHQDVFEQICEFYWDLPDAQINDVTGEIVRCTMASLLVRPDRFNKVVDRISIYPLDAYEKQILASRIQEDLVGFVLEEYFDDQTIIEEIEQWKAEFAEEEEGAS
tara:strand:- start:687 stop:1181 length:495 start_codon:yes stop_codon:yes gene_type:complete